MIDIGILYEPESTCVPVVTEWNAGALPHWAGETAIMHSLAQALRYMLTYATFSSPGGGQEQSVWVTAI